MHNAIEFPSYLLDRLARAVRERDIAELSRVVDAAREEGFTYRVLRDAARHLGVDRYEWDGLMEACDNHVGQGEV